MRPMRQPPGLPRFSACRSRTAALRKWRSRLVFPPSRRACRADGQRRSFAHQAGGAVLDGRDISTVMCRMGHQLYVTASPQVRAEARDLWSAPRPGADIAAMRKRDTARDARDMGVIMRRSPKPQTGLARYQRIGYRQKPSKGRRLPGGFGWTSPTR